MPLYITYAATHPWGSGDEGEGYFVPGFVVLAARICKVGEIAPKSSVVKYFLDLNGCTEAAIVILHSRQKSAEWLLQF